MSKKYFAKWLPVEGEIKDGDYWQHPDGPVFPYTEAHAKGPIKTLKPKKVKLFLCSGDIQVGDNILWEKQTYCADEKYKDYIGKVYKLEAPLGKGLGMIVLKNYYPKKSIDECRNSIITSMSRWNKEWTKEQIEENAIRNQETSGDLHLKVGYNISEYDVIKVIGEISPEAKWVKEGDEFDSSDLLFQEKYFEMGNPKIQIKCPCCGSFK